MQAFLGHKVLFIVVVILSVIVCFVLIEFLIIRYNGTPVPAPDILRGKQTIGSGAPLTYVVLGDSTSISQGGDYQQGYAVKSAEHLALENRVTYQNFGVSGARVADIRHKQLPDALKINPDVVLIGVGANDVTHLTPLGAIERDMNVVVDELRAANSNVKIIITGAAQMGSVPRFPQPAKWIAKQRTAQVNEAMKRVAISKKLTFAPIADKTGPVFEKNPQLFAQDKFHPTTEGYKLWVVVIIDAL